MDSIAPGLQTLPDSLARFGATVDALRAGDFDNLLALGVDGLVGLLIIAAVIWLALCFFLRSLMLRQTLPSPVASENTAARAQYQRRVALPKTGNRSWLGKHSTRWVEPISLAGVTVETSQKHIAIGATTGARKTTVIANMIMQARRPCVVIAGDSSPYALEAMRARGWRVWSADGKNGGLYVHEGTPNEAAQIVTVLLNPRKSVGDTGLQRGMARGVFRQCYVAMDAAGVARSWPGLRAALLDAGPPEGIPNRNFDSARANWLARIDELMEALGPALGHDISVLDCVRSECGLFFDLNAFSDLDLATCFGEAAVRLTQHAADKTGNFWWIIDELALFDADLLGQIVRTCRIRRVKFVGASQIISDFGKTLRGLVKIWLVGEQTAADHESRKWCSDLTMGAVPPENFSEHATPPGFYYVVADGRTQSLQVKPWHHPRPVQPVKIWSTRPAPDTTVQTVQPSQKHSLTVDPDTVSETTIQRPTVLVYGPPVMPPHWADDPQLENIWLHTVLPDGLTGCYESTYRVNNSDRPMCTYKSDPEQPTMQWLVYALSLALYDALTMHMSDDDRIGYMRLVRMHMGAKILTVEHQCENVRCHRTDHIEWFDRGGNVKLYFERRRQAAAA